LYKVFELPMKHSTVPIVSYREEAAPPITTNLLTPTEEALSSPNNAAPRFPRPWTSVLLLLAFGWRLIGLTTQSFWRDEIDVIFLSIRPLSETFRMFISPAQNGPLYYLMLRPWLYLVGSSEFATRYVSVLAGTLAVAVLWQVARQLLPSDNRLSLGNSPLLAVLFLAFNPYQLWYSQEGKMYALVMLLTLLSTWSWLEAMRKGGGGRWLRYLLITTISIYTHLLTALLLPLHFIWFLLAWPLNQRRWQGYTLTLAGFVLPYTPLIWWQWHYLTTLNYQTGYGFTPFAEVARILLLGHTRGAFVNVGMVWLVPIFFIALAGLLVGAIEMRVAQNQEPASSPSPLLPIHGGLRTAMLASWLILPVLLIHGISLIKPIFVDRYVIWIAPAFVMILALGIGVVRHSGGRWATVLALLLVGYVTGFWLWTGWQQTHTPNKTQLRQAITYVAERRQSDDLLILQIPHTHYAFRYYTSNFTADPFANSDERLSPWIEGLWTHNGLPDDEAMSQVGEIMARQTAPYDEAWVLLVEASSWDPRRLMDRWLDTHGELLEQVQFHGIEARRYRLP
jgi:4-amino-4-deoxy-L-arabinose transferase-like glycosyltransferase